MAAIGTANMNIMEMKLGIQIFQLFINENGVKRMEEMKEEIGTMVRGI